MLSESGASERPACIALYSSVICRKIGSAIIAPPKVICCSICWEMPIVKCGNLNRPGSSSVSFPRAFGVRASRPAHERDRADDHEQHDVVAAFLPDEDAEDDAAHPQHG